MSYPLDTSLARLFIDQALAAPDAIAVVDEAGETTYGGLAERLATIAAFLRRRGLADEEAVGVLMKRSSDLIAALLAVLSSGGAYVPLDPDDPPERNQRICRKAGVRLVLTDRDLGAGVLPVQDVEFVIVAELTGAAALPADLPGGGKLAYILFTSGSTGEPKGVEIEHRAAVNLVCAARELLGFGPADRYLATATIGFDISVAELFVPLVSGGSLLLRDRKTWLNPRGLVEDVKRHGVTVIQCGPSVWSVLLAEAPDLPRVRIAITTGEPVPPALARRLLAMGENVWNLYGPTETTVWSTAHRLTPDMAGDSPISASIGLPIANTTVSIVDEDGVPVPDGAEGELWIGGMGLARGYRGDPELTRERFVADEAGNRQYRTGDLVSRSMAGELVYFGRNDDQMKIRGVRIEPREVEAAILLCREISQAAATWFENPDGSRSIIAAVVLSKGCVLGPAQLHQALTERLSPQMIPSRWLFLDEIPLSPSGKVDRKTIRAGAKLTNANHSQGPELTPTEVTLGGVWRRILNVPGVSADDHFFSIGGDSLAAVRMIAETEQRFQIELPVQAIFEAPTLASLAARIDGVLAGVQAARESDYIFSLVEGHGGRAVFFNNVDLKLAVRGVWPAAGTLYAISHWAQGRGFVNAKSVEDLARTHLARVREIQPTGPYRIAGFSFGGLVAFEMAHQLRSAGQEVEMLFLLDPMLPYRTEAAPHGCAREWQVKPLDENWFGWGTRHLGNLVREPWKIGAYIVERLRWHAEFSPFKQWLIYRLVHLHSRRPNPISKRIVPRDRWPAFWYSARRMSHHYVARPYVGPMLAVFPDRGENYGVWKELLDPTGQLIFTPAGHNELFNEPARSQWLDPLAERLAALESSVPTTE